MMTLRNQAPARIMLGQPHVQLKELQPGEDVHLTTLPLVYLHVCVCLFLCESMMSLYFVPVSSPEARGATWFQTNVCCSPDPGAKKQAQRGGWHFQVSGI